jgi:hypothetical protein
MITTSIIDNLPSGYILTRDNQLLVRNNAATENVIVSYGIKWGKYLDSRFDGSEIIIRLVQ